MTRPQPRRPTRAVTRLTLQMVLTEHEEAALEDRIVALVQEGMRVSEAEKRAQRELYRGER